MTRRFRARIRKEAVNPYVEVPARVSQAFASHARSGRIRVSGLLDRVPVRGTLVPRRGGHRFYVNGGMRSAAGVSVGDTVTLRLAAERAHEVRLPPDLVAALDRSKDARTAFRALSPSHRRELLRYVDDARSARARRARIERALAHALGRTTTRTRPAAAASRALWTCPRCGNAFVNRNQYHACRRVELDQPFRGKPAAVRELFDRLRALVEACGPTRLVPYRDRVGFMARVRFAGATPRSKWLDVSFWLSRRVASPRFRGVETIAPDVHIHRMRIREPRELDREVAAWIREAHAIGRQEPLKPRRTDRA